MFMKIDLCGTCSQTDLETDLSMPYAENEKKELRKPLEETYNNKFI